MKINLPLKISGSKSNITKWILEEFPENYIDLVYIELFLSDGNILLNKEESKTEIASGEPDTLSMFAAIRDECKELCNRLKRKKLNQNIFTKATKHSSDYLESAINEFLSIKLSKGGNKKTFSDKDFDWGEDIKGLPKVSDRLKNVFLLAKPYKDIIKAFNDKDTLCYVNCEPFDWPEEKHIEIAYALKDFKGKAIVAHKTCPLYKKLYKTWKKTEKKLSTGNESLWKNY